MVPPEVVYGDQIRMADLCERARLELEALAVGTPELAQQQRPPSPEQLRILDLEGPGEEPLAEHPAHPESTDLAERPRI